MGVRFGVCIALMLLLLIMLVLPYNACMITTSRPFAVLPSVDAHKLLLTELGFLPL